LKAKTKSKWHRDQQQQPSCEGSINRKRRRRRQTPLKMVDLGD